MNKFIKPLLLLLASIFLTSCATIVGGRTYKAHVVVTNNQFPDIYYNGQLKGKGEATFEVERKEANRLMIILEHEGCETQIKQFNKRKFRVWACVGTLFTWTFITNGIPIPAGLVVDLANGSIWKPDKNEKDVFKKNFDEYTYRVDYTGCKEKTLKIQDQK